MRQFACRPCIRVQAIFFALSFILSPSSADAVVVARIERNGSASGSAANKGLPVIDRPGEPTEATPQPENVASVEEKSSNEGASDLPPDSIHFEVAPDSPARDLTLHIHLGSSSAYYTSGHLAVRNAFGRVCKAPCESNLVAGEYAFGLSRGMAPVVLVTSYTKIEGGERLVAYYKSNRAIRRGGLVLILLTTMVGASLAGYGGGHLAKALDSKDSSATENVGKATLISGGVVAVVGAVVGMVMLFKRDQTRLNVVPRRERALPVNPAL